jgi:hypothetical protein
MLTVEDASSVEEETPRRRWVMDDYSEDERYGKQARRVRVEACMYKQATTSLSGKVQTTCTSCFRRQRNAGSKDGASVASGRRQATDACRTPYSLRMVRLSLAASHLRQSHARTPAHAAKTGCIVVYRRDMHAGAVEPRPTDTQR